MIEKGNAYCLSGLSVLVILTFAVLLGTSFIENNLAVLITGFVYIALGVLFTAFLSKKEFKNSLFLFFLFFQIYLLHMSIVHHGLELLYNRSNIAQDELWFYATSNQITSSLKSGYTLFDLADIFEYHESPAYIYLSGWLAIFSNYAGFNSVFIQKLIIVFFASLIPVVLYLILKMYVKEKTAVYGAVVYGMFTFITPISTMVLRDIPVALTYIIFFLFIIEKVSIRNIILISIVSVFSYFLRVETGIFLIGMSSVYLIYGFNYFVKNKTIRIAVISILIFTFFTLLLQFNFIDMFLKVNEASIDHASENAQKGSLAMKLISLPYGLNIISMAIFSQMQPFPSWIVLKDFGILLLFSMIGGITWFFVWSFLIYGIFKLKILKIIDIKLKYLFYFSIIYIVLIGGSEGVTRRLLAVYPVIFLISLLSFIEINKKNKFIIIFITSFVYIMLNTSYLILKS